METEVSTGHQIRFIADSRIIYHPRFANKEKTRIKAIVPMPDGRLSEMEADLTDPRSPLIRDLFYQYTLADVERFTQWEVAVLVEKSKVDQRVLEDKMRDEEREVLFHAKAKALELPEVKTCKDKRIKEKIRKAKSAFEVAAWISIALTQSLQDEVNN